MKTEDIFNANSYTSKAMPIVHLIINKNVINGVTVTSPVQVIGTEKPLDELTAEFVKQFKGLSYQDKLDIMQAVADKYKTVALDKT